MQHKQYVRSSRSFSFNRNSSWQWGQTDLTKCDVNLHWYTKYPFMTVIFTFIRWSWSSLIESQLPVFIVFYLHVLNNHLSRTSQIKLGIVLWVQRCTTYCKLSNSVRTNIMHKHYTSQSAYGYDQEVQLIVNSVQLFCISVLFYAM